MEQMRESSVDLASLFLSLENERFYSVSDLIDRAERLGLVGDDESAQKQTLFYMLLAVVQDRAFPVHGDVAGRVEEGRGGRDPAWLGLRWEEALARPN